MLGSSSVSTCQDIRNIKQGATFLSFSTVQMEVMCMGKEWINSPKHKKMTGKLHYKGKGKSRFRKDLAILLIFISLPLESSIFIF